MVMGFCGLSVLSMAIFWPISFCSFLVSGWSFGSGIAICFLWVHVRRAMVCVSLFSILSSVPIASSQGLRCIS